MLTLQGKAYLVATHYSPHARTCQDSKNRAIQSLSTGLLPHAPRIRCYRMSLPCPPTKPEHGDLGWEYTSLIAADMRMFM